MATDVYVAGSRQGAGVSYKEMIWQHHHYRFGLAGQGQADIIQRYLEQVRGRVLYIGCGPWIEPLRNLLPYCFSLIAADKEPPSIELLTKSGAFPSLHLCRMDANQLSVKSESFDFILALGLFVYIREPETVRVGERLLQIVAKWRKESVL